MSLTTSVYGGNLGDTLWVTPLARYEPDLTVWMRGDDAKARSVAPILDGLCKLRLEPHPPETAKAQIRAHVTQQILAAYGHAGKPSIPRVLLKPEEVMWAVDYLKVVTSGHSSKVVAIVNHCSGSADPTNHRAHYVRGSVETYAALAAFWIGAGYKVLQFGPKAGFYDRDIVTPIKGAVSVRGLSVRQLAAVYHVVGKLISPDTGDYHLMLAVGGRAACLVPPHSDQMGYRWWDLHYDQTCWGDEPARVTYALHSDWTRFLNTNLFD
jgi:ADP-heptose:LPS heptosyltransferase